MNTADGSGLLRDCWYFAAPSAQVKAGRMLSLMLLGEPVLLARDGAGRAFALADLCPHRGMPLGEGRFDGREIECCYHGWRFDASGTCTAIPWLVEGQNVHLDRIKVRAYPVHEALGCLWVYVGAQLAEGAALPEPPPVPDIGVKRPSLFQSMVFPCHMDHAVIGLMDPAHGPFVHTSWWWRPGRRMEVKEKAFGPSPLGFRMKRHRPARNARGYYIFLGGTPETEIAFRLPGVRIEHIAAGRHQVVHVTATTPVDDKTTQVNHAMWWTVPFLSAIKPFAAYVTRAFIAQDRDVVIRQQRGLKHDPPMMLVKDADQLAQWYFRLKKEYAASRAEKREFRNPVEDTVLRWRS